MSGLGSPYRCRFASIAGHRVPLSEALFVNRFFGGAYRKHADHRRTVICRRHAWHLVTGPRVPVNGGDVIAGYDLKDLRAQLGMST